MPLTSGHAAFRQSVTAGFRLGRLPAGSHYGRTPDAARRPQAASRSRCLAPAARGPLDQAPQRERPGLLSGCRLRLPHPRARGGPKTGRGPVDRGRTGSTPPDHRRHRHSARRHPDRRQPQRRHSAHPAPPSRAARAPQARLAEAPPGQAGRPADPSEARNQAPAMVRPGIGSASAALQAGAPKGSAKYCVSCTTCWSANSMMLTEYEGTPS
jgi:hypothetical protein